MKNNKLKYGSMTLIYIAIFIIALVVVNVLVSLLSTKLNMQFDMTIDNRYELSEETYTLLDAIDQPIAITVFNTENELQEDELSLVIYEQLKRYAANSDYITVTFVDPDLNPAVVKEYQEAYPSTARGSIAVKNTQTGAVKVVYTEDLVAVTTDAYNAYMYYGIAPGYEDFDIKSEGAIDSALQYVLNEVNAKAAFIVGHDSYFPSGEESSATARKTYMTNVLTRANFEVIDIDLRTQELPADIDLLIIMPPSSDFSTDELNKLDEYFGRANRNHAAIFLTVADGAWQPNLVEYLAEWGVGLNYRLILDTQSTTYPSLFVPTIVEHDIFGGMTNKSNDAVQVYQIPPLTLLWNSSEKGNHKVEQLMISSSNSVARDLSDYENSANDQTGPFTIGALCWQNNIENTATQSLTSTSKIAVLPGTLSEMSSASVANERMMTHIVNYLVPQSVSISIPAKQLVNAPMTINNKLLLWVLLMLIPAALLATGLVVFLRRRHL